ncbi:MAG: peptidoglycan DD-metalloendopeptidase family protein [Candidatus Magasanikbacteria bacterium]|nr:peptidoglycan DD-metalloendopeptidase family protein [Candidatus Magasanikbacteria bacterium]
MQKRVKITLFLLLTFGLFFISSFLVLADTTSTANPEVEQLNKEIQLRKDKIKQLEDTINSYKQNIAQKQTEGVSLKNQMSIIDNHIAQTQADVDLTNEELQKTQLEIDSLNISIDEKEVAIDREKKMISKMIQSLHANDQKNFLEIMLTNSNFADFYDQAKYLESVYTDLGRTVKGVRIAKEDMDAKKVLAEAKKEEYNQFLDQLSNQKKDLTDEKTNKEGLLVQTKSSEVRYQTMLDSLRSQYKVVENEVSSFESQVRKKLSQQDRFNSQSSDGGDFGWPVSGHYITARFHDPDYPFQNVFQHSGVDIRMPQGSVVHAAASGYIGRAKRCTLASCYSYVLIIHNGNLSTLYGHLSSILINDEQFVNKGDIIGYSGGTPGMVGSGPFVTGAHLHFEVRVNGIPVDPMGYLP